MGSAFRKWRCVHPAMQQGRRRGSGGHSSDALRTDVDRLMALRPDSAIIVTYTQGGGVRRTFIFLPTLPLESFSIPFTGSLQPTYSSCKAVRLCTNHPYFALKLKNFRAPTPQLTQSSNARKSHTLDFSRKNVTGSDMIPLECTPRLGGFPLPAVLACLSRSPWKVRTWPA